MDWRRGFIFAVIHLAIPLTALLALSSAAQQPTPNVNVPDEVAVPILDSPLPLSVPQRTKCPDPHLRSAEIGGSEISAALVKAHKPVAGARAELFSGQKLVWSGATNSNGTFVIRNLAPGLYTLRVEQWGTTTVRLNPKLDRIGGQSMGQIEYYHLLLMDNGCVGTGVITN